MVWYKDIADRLAVALALAVVADATLGASSVAIDIPSLQQRPR